MIFLQQPQTTASIASGTSTAPRKPPRRNVSVSPVRGQASGSQKPGRVPNQPQHYNTISTHKVRRQHDHSRQQDYSVKRKAAPHDPVERSISSGATIAVAKSSAVKTSVYSSKSGSKSFDELDDILSEKVKESRPSTASVASMMDETSRHSCDELMMTRSLFEAETSDTASQVRKLSNGQPKSQ